MTAALYTAMPVWVLATSLITAVVIFTAGEGRQRLRVAMNLLGAVLKVLLVGVMLGGVAAGHEFTVRLALLPGIEFVLHADALTMLFGTLSSVLWLITTIYAIGYLEQGANRARFFGFFSLCVAATMGIALAGNLFTFFVFYEMLTLSTWPLVVHSGSREAIAAGRTYLRYTLGGSAALLLGIVSLYAFAGPHDFITGGYLLEEAAFHEPLLLAIFALLITGMAVKAAMVPLHRWLPGAMVAPAPVSALLHAVAVVKAGAFGIVRVVQDVYGVELVATLQLDTLLAVAASFTIIYGSLRALAQTNLKQRLAYSTVSQVSYIALGMAMGSPLATVGGLVHLVHQGLMKITLFFCAGIYGKVRGIHTIDELDGMGRRLPWTTTAFTLGALGMMGVPPLAGFISKWHLGLGSVAAGQHWVIGVLLASTALNALYFLPLLHRLWFRSPQDEADTAPRGGRDREAPPGLLWPTVATAVGALGAGLFAGVPWSPLAWAEFIVEREYLP